VDPEERAVLERVLAEEDDVAAGHGLLQRFRRLVAIRDAAALDGWLADAATSGPGPFVSMAVGIALDRAAVDAALTTDWSNGPVEGSSTRSSCSAPGLRSGRTRPAARPRARRLTDPRDAIMPTPYPTPRSAGEPYTAVHCPSWR
jgi:hypothetical protein